MAERPSIGCSQRPHVPSRSVLTALRRRYLLPLRLPTAQIADSVLGRPVAVCAGWTCPVVLALVACLLRPASALGAAEA